MSTHDIERLNDDDKKVIGNTTSTTQPSRLRTNRSMLYICIKKDQRDKLSSEVNGLIYLFVIKVLTGRWANSNFDGLAMWIDKFEFRHKSTNLRRRRESQKCSKKELFFIDSTLRLRRSVDVKLPISSKSHRSIRISKIGEIVPRVFL